MATTSPKRDHVIRALRADRAASHRHIARRTGTTPQYVASVASSANLKRVRRRPGTPARRLPGTPAVRVVKHSPTSRERAAPGLFSGEKVGAVQSGSRRRKYKHPVTGQSSPSVTTLLKELNGDGILIWQINRVIETAVNQPFDPDFETEQEARQRLRSARFTNSSTGTATHKHFERQTPVRDAPKGVRRLLAAAYDAVDTLGLRRLATETAIWGDGYTGSADLWAEDSDGQLVVVDLKTTSKTGDDMKVYPDACAQVAAYANCDLISDGESAHRMVRRPAYGLIIVVNQDGQWISKQVDISREGPAFQMFDLCQNISHVRSRVQKQISARSGVNTRKGQAA